MGIIGIIILVLLLIGVPIGVAFWLPAVLGADAVGVDPSMIAASVPFQTATGFALLAIPYFILAGRIMHDGGVVRHIINFAQLLLGWVKGSIGYVVIAASALFGATTGSSVATVATISASMGEEMVQKGYKRDYVASLIASSGLLGVLIPPSIPMIIFAAAVGESVGELFLAILLPGLIFIVAFMATHASFGKKAMISGSAVTEAFSYSKLSDKPRRIVLNAIAPLMMPVIMLGGIYSGIFTPTEAAAAGATYGLILALVTRGLKIKALPRTFFMAAVPSAAILIIISLASVFDRVLTLQQVPQVLSQWMTGLIGSQAAFILVLVLFTFVIGTFMETNSSILIMAPLLFPTAMAFDVNPIHFGVVLVISLELGMISPPMAVNIFVAAKGVKGSLVRMMPFILRYVLVAFGAVLVIAFIPWLTTWHL